MFRKNIRSESGTVLLWTIGVFSVSLLVLGALISLTSYFSQSMELQSKLEIATTNASDHLDFETFYQTGDIEDVVFFESEMLAAVAIDLMQIKREFGSYQILEWRVIGNEFWIEISHPWHPPLGDFSVLPNVVTAKVHLKLDSNRHLQ